MNLHQAAQVKVNQCLAAVTLHGTYAKLTISEHLQVRVDLTDAPFPVTLPCIVMSKRTQFQAIATVEAP